MVKTSGLIKLWKHSTGKRDIQSKVCSFAKDGAGLAKAFFMIAFICGMLITFILPPLCAPDENVHFVNAFCMSRLDLFPDDYEGKLVRLIPAYYSDYINKYPITLNGIGNSNSYQYNELYIDSYGYDPDADETPAVFEQYICSVGYIVSAASMAIGRGLGSLFGTWEVDLPYNQMLFGRIGNLIFYVAVIYFAIRKAPHFKKTIMLIALMPISLFLGSSLSYDAVIIPVSLYYFALILSLCVNPNERICLTDICRVLICVYVFAGIKFGAYLPMIALLLVIPKSKYGSTHRLIVCIAAVCVAVAIGYLPTLIIRGQEARLNAGEAETMVSNATVQRQWLMSNLSAIPELISNSFGMRWGVYLHSFWGQLGWLDTYVPGPIMLVGYSVLFGVCLFETCSFGIWQGYRWKNLIALFGGFAGLIGVMLGMFVSFTPPGTPWIEGVQGRYFIPLFLAFALALSNPLLLYIPIQRRVIAEQRFETISKVWGGFCAVLTVLVLLCRYWIR